MAKYKIELEMDFNRDYNKPTTCKECPFYMMDYDTREYYYCLLYGIGLEDDEKLDICPIISIEKE